MHDLYGTIYDQSMINLVETRVAKNSQKRLLFLSIVYIELSLRIEIMDFVIFN